MSKSDIAIYHNPRCGKSRSALALLQEAGVTPRIIEYLKTSPNKADLQELVRKLGIAPEALLRKGEEVFKENFAGKSLSDEECISAMAEHPILIERPIVVRGERAVVGRPPERVLELLK